MIDAEFGAANMPPPIPFATVRSAKVQYEKFAGISMSPTKLAPNTTMPAVANPRAPNRSDRYPDMGPEMRIPAVSGSRKMPAHNGVAL
jgi:hypothetical protein